MTLKPPTLKPANQLTKDGTALFNRVAEEALHGHRRLLDNLTEHERRTVLDWLASAVSEGTVENSVYNLLWEIDFSRRPVDIETFLMDEYYFGSTCSKLDDKWVHDLKQVFRFGSPVIEWILTGAIGIGKTTIAAAALGYKLYWLSCLRDAALYYGLLKDSMIVFGIYSITKKQVNDSGYNTLRGFVDSSPYFRRDFPRNAKIDSKVSFPHHNMQVITGSSNLHAIGLNLFTFLMDEVNFMRAKQDADTGKMAGQAYELYNSTNKRLVSRFIRPGGTIPGLMLLLSSRNSQTSFLEERLKKTAGSPSTYVSDYALWDVKAKHLFTLPKFKVEVGDRIARSRVLKTPKLELIRQALDKKLNAQEVTKAVEALPAGVEEKPRHGASVVDIPGELLKFFQEDTDQSLRDFAGVATFNLSPLIKDRQSVFDAFKSSMKHPFKQDQITIDIHDPTMIEDYLDIRALCRTQDSKWVPRVNPAAPRFLHGDLSKNADSSGIAMAHLAGMKRITRFNPLDGTESVIEAPYVVVDFMIRINPPVGSEIDLSKFRAFFVWLAKIFRVTSMTFDGFQSLDSQQTLKKMGYDAGETSMDRTDGPYMALRSSMSERRIAMYQYQQFEDEILDLQYHLDGRKVDHPDRSSRGGKGTKDVSDAVCGAVYNALTHKESLYVAKAVTIEDFKVVDSETNALTTGIPDAPVVVGAGNPVMVSKPNPVRSGWKNLQSNLKP